MAERPAGGGRRSRRRRLSRSAEFDRVYRDGRSRANRYLVVHAFPRGDGEPPRLGVSVSRKVGGAVERNRVKRLLREAFWSQADAVPAEHDFVVVARPDARELAERSGVTGIGEALGELLSEHAGGAPAEPRGAASSEPAGQVPTEHRGGSPSGHAEGATAKDPGEAPSERAAEAPSERAGETS